MGFDADKLPSGMCMTCSTFGVPCASIDKYPNATVTEYGSISGEQKMMNEIMERGPIGCGVNAVPLLNYTGGVFTHDMQPLFNMVDHEVAVVGWGVDENGVKYWDMRNSWGEYWGRWAGHASSVVRTPSNSRAPAIGQSAAIPPPTSRAVRMVPSAETTTITRHRFCSCFMRIPEWLAVGETLALSDSSLRRHCLRPAPHVLEALHILT